jgi:hypothetical protein
MYANNYKIDLMIPSQINKDVIFNEAIIKLDSFCNIAAESFILELPLEIIPGILYILSEGPNKHSICYSPSKASGWKIQKPTRNMIYYIKSESNFFCFNGENWEAI